MQEIKTWNMYHVKENRTWSYVVSTILCFYVFVTLKKSIYSHMIYVKKEMCLLQIKYL